MVVDNISEWSYSCAIAGWHVYEHWIPPGKSRLSNSPRSTARKIAKHGGITERTTLKIISDLELEGYIVRRKEGRRNVYRVDPELPLRHHTKEEIMLSELLKALTAK